MTTTTFNSDKSYREFRSETLRELQSLQKLWRKQDLSFTVDQQKRYDQLTAFRRQQVRNFYTDDQVWIGPSKAGQPLDEKEEA